MNSEIKEIGNRFFTLYPRRILYRQTSLLDTHLLIADSIENFEVYDDDIWLCGIPKSGTTWSQEMVWNIANDLNFEAATLDLHDRFPFLEYSGIYGKPKENDAQTPASFENSIEFIKKLPRPRFIKTHLPFHLLPRQLRANEKKAKIVYMWRHPKDVCVSYYHFLKWTNEYTGDIKNFCKLFLNDIVLFLPYWNHVIEFWNRQKEKNILFLKYEDMKADLRSAIRKTANFLGKNLNDEQISKLEDHLSFSSMSANSSVNSENLVKSNMFNGEGSFIRKGEAGQWKDVMPNEIIEQFDRWIHENLKNHKSLLLETL